MTTEIVVTDEQFAGLFDRRHVAVLACGHWTWDDGRNYALGAQVSCSQCGAESLLGGRPNRPRMVVGVGELVVPKRAEGGEG